MMEQCLIEHCAPTLAAMKSASLFTQAYHTEEELQRYVDVWNTQLNEKNVVMCVLRKRDHIALLYVYRETLLKKDIEKDGVWYFLKTYGYQEMNVQNIIEYLKHRLDICETFPHEIGLFLGYPLDDVKGFIQHQGHHSKCAGCWKVYGDECEAKKLFTKFNKCRDVYKRLWSQGNSVLQLTVTV